MHLGAFGKHLEASLEASWEASLEASLEAPNLTPTDPPPLWESRAALGAALPETAAPVAAMIVLFWVIAVTITLYNKWTFSSQRTPPTPPSATHHH